MHETKVQTQQQQAQLTEQEAKIASNKAATDAAVARFGQLDDYYILDETTVISGTVRSTLIPNTTHSFWR